MGRIRKIYNGYTVPAALPTAPKIICEIPPNAFVIGMVSRGIREKGWEILIAAFQSLNLPDSRLLLVGDGTTSATPGETFVTSGYSSQGMCTIRLVT